MLHNSIWGGLDQCLGD